MQLERQCRGVEMYDIGFATKLPPSRDLWSIEEHADRAPLMVLPSALDPLAGDHHAQWNEQRSIHASSTPPWPRIMCYLVARGPPIGRPGTAVSVCR